MNDNVLEAVVWITGLVVGAYLTTHGYADTFKPLTAALFMALTARHTRAALAPREVIKRMREENSGARKLPEDHDVR